MTSETAPELHRLQEQQRRLNRETWAQLQAHGVTPATLLTPDANFWATSPAAATLAAHLRDELGYAVRLDASGRGLLRRKRLWSVVGTTPPRTLDLDLIDAWTDEMVAAAFEHDAEFEGWGTLLPG